VASGNAPVKSVIHITQMTTATRSGKDEDSLGAGIGILALLGAIGFGLYVFDWDTFESNTITDYTISCTIDNLQGECPKEKWVQNPYIVYKINADTQVVVQQVQGQPPDKLTGCAVIDKNNWKCTNGARGGTWYQDGYLYGIKDSNQPAFRHVARWEWIVTKDSKNK
jgi:hypothetical protein